eukprot:686387-Pleurochrysis_carterae.AAC.2
MRAVAIAPRLLCLVIAHRGLEHAAQHHQPLPRAELQVVGERAVGRRRGPQREVRHRRGCQVADLGKRALRLLHARRARAGVGDRQLRSWLLRIGYVTHGVACGSPAMKTF